MNSKRKQSVFCRHLLAEGEILWGQVYVCRICLRPLPVTRQSALRRDPSFARMTRAAQRLVVEMEYARERATRLGAQTEAQHD